jgi:hypothetical protein
MRKLLCGHYAEFMLHFSKIVSKSHGEICSTLTL